MDGHLTDPFGQATAQATTFFGLSFDAIAVNGDDGLDGVSSFVTGAASVQWTTSNASAVQAFLGSVPTNLDCSQAADYASVATGAASGNAALGTLTRDRCLKLVATNAAPQTSSVFVRLIELPEVTSMSTSPGSITRAAGGTIVVGMGLRGAVHLSLIVDYLDTNGVVQSSADVCTEASLNSGSLAGGAGVDNVSCRDTYDGTGCIALCRKIPAGTATMHYRVAATDEEAESASGQTSGAGDVTVQ